MNNIYKRLIKASFLTLFFGLSYSAYGQYCEPTYSTGCSFGDDLNDVVLEGNSITLSNTGSGCNGDFTDNTSMDAPDLTPGMEYTISVGTSYSSPQFESARVWIDYNENGTFDTDEVIAEFSQLSAGLNNITFEVPITAFPGTKRMRVKVDYTQDATTIDPCAGVAYGETEDYSVEIESLTDCAGQPDAGTVSGPTSVCSATPFSVSVTDFTTGGGIVRQWQKREPTEDNIWEDIAGASGGSISMPGGITVETQYRFYIECEVSELSDTSNVWTVEINPPGQCYCTPVYSTACSSGDRINGFSLIGDNGTEIDNQNSGCSTNGYGDYTNTYAPVELTPTLSYTGTVSTDYSSPSYEYVRIWIDWNDDGSFDAADEIAAIDGLVSGGSNFTFDVPPTAPPGEHRMRVRLVYNANPASGIDPCATATYGETEDYLVEVASLTACSGQPDAGTVDGAASIEICSGVAFNLSVLGATQGGDMTYQWQKREPSGTNTWEDIAGANSFNLNLGSGVATETDFRFYIVCDNSNLADTTNVINVTLSDPITCYCIPTATSSSYPITDFSTTGGNENISNPASGFSTGGYGDFTAMTVSQDVGGTINFSATISGTTAGIKIWVDWNQNGNFVDVGEIAYQSSAYSSTHTGSFSVPANAVPGITRMRIGSHWLNSSGPVSPCEVNFTGGEFEDYSFEITTPTCMPVTGITVSDVTETGATVSWDEPVPAPADGYEYYFSTTNTPPSGSTEATGTTTDTEVVFDDLAYGEYFVWIRSVCGEEDVSSWQGPANFYTGYCLPSNTTNTTYYIDAVETEGALQNIVNIGTGFSPNGYGDFSETDTLTVYPGQQFTITFTHPSSTNGYSVWVDWNNDFDFDDTGELIFASGYESSPITFTIQVPTTSPEVTTRMRVRNAYVSNPAPACGEFQYGEAEDYTFKVVEAPSCLPPLNASLTGQSSSTATIQWTEQNGSATWNVIYGPPGFVPGSGDGTIIEGVTENPYTVTGLTDNTTYDIYVQTDCGGDDYSFWTGPVTVNTDCLTFPIPFVEGYEDDSETINCWSNDVVTGTATWTIGTGANGGAITTAFEGTKNAVFDGGSLNSANFITPTLDFGDQDSVALVFAYGQENWFGDQNTLKVFARTEDDADWISQKSYNQDTPEWKVDTIMIHRATDTLQGAELKIAFQGTSNYGRPNVLDNVQIYPCSAEPGVDGYLDACRLDGTVDLMTAITPGETWGKWIFPSNQGLVNGTQFNISTLPTGAYEVFYVVESPCVSDTTVATISVFGASSAGIGGELTVCKGQAFQLHEGLSGSVDMGGDWYDYDGNLLGTTQPHASSEAGVYEYTYMVSNGVCPIDTAIVTVTVPEDCGLSIEVESFEDISVYPNPASDQLNIVNPSNTQSLKIEMTDLNGRIVLENNKVLNNATEGMIEIGSLAKGIYTLKVYNKEGQRVFKIVKQ